jgi:DNA-binding transcriptional LysR family regulator
VLQKRIIGSELGNWDDMRIFLAVIDDGNFRKASDRLKIERSTVSRRIDQLEHRLRAQLFERRSDGAVPTPAAHEIVTHARAMAAQAQAIERQLAGFNDQLAGIVRVTVTEGLASAWLTRNLTAFSLEHPDITLEILVVDDVLSVDQRQADVAIRLASPTEPDLIVQRVGHLVFRLYTTGDYVQRAGLPTNLHELTQHQIIDHVAYRDGPVWSRWHDIVEQCRPTVRTTSSGAYLNCVLSGMGIGILPTYVSRVHPTLIPIPIEMGISLPIYLVSHPETNKTRRITSVLSHLKRIFDRDRAWFSAPECVQRVSRG